MSENNTEIIINIESEPQEAFYSIYAGLTFFIEHKDYVRRLKGKDELFISQLEAQSILYDLEKDNPELTEVAKGWLGKELSRFSIDKEEKKYSVSEIQEFLQNQTSIEEAFMNLNKLK